MTEEHQLLIEREIKTGVVFAGQAQAVLKQMEALCVRR